MKKKNRGQSLVMVVFILGMVALLLSGLAAGATFSIKAIRYSRNKASATRIAREQIEAIKSQKQSSSFWEDLDLVLNEEMDCPDGGLIDNFSCRIKYTNLSKDALSGKKQVTLTVKVWWDSTEEPSGKKKKVQVETVLSNWEE
ncbi:hypothetical protein J7J95_03360 [bacterium]|nr:hypothetical protein [bacterium]